MRLLWRWRALAGPRKGPRVARSILANLATATARSSTFNSPCSATCTSAMVTRLTDVRTPAPGQETDQPCVVNAVCPGATSVNGGCLFFATDSWWILDPVLVFCLTALQLRSVDLPFAQPTICTFAVGATSTGLWPLTDRSISGDFCWQTSAFLSSALTFTVILSWWSKYARSSFCRGPPWQSLSAVT
jgi:hypothetical protein